MRLGHGRGPAPPAQILKNRLGVHLHVEQLVLLRSWTSAWQDSSWVLPQYYLLGRFWAASKQVVMSVSGEVSPIGELWFPDIKTRRSGSLNTITAPVGLAYSNANGKSFVAYIPGPVDNDWNEETHR